MVAWSNMLQSETGCGDRDGELDKVFRRAEHEWLLAMLTAHIYTTPEALTLVAEHNSVGGAKRFLFNSSKVA